MANRFEKAGPSYFAPNLPEYKVPDLKWHQALLEKKYKTEVAEAQTAAVVGGSLAGLEFNSMPLYSSSVNESDGFVENPYKDKVGNLAAKISATKKNLVGAIQNGNDVERQQYLNELKSLAREEAGTVSEVARVNELITNANTNQNKFIEKAKEAEAKGVNKSLSFGGLNPIYESLFNSMYGGNSNVDVSAGVQYSPQEHFEWTEKFLKKDKNTILSGFTVEQLVGIKSGKTSVSYMDYDKVRRALTSTIQGNSAITATIESSIAQKRNVVSYTLNRRLAEEAKAKVLAGESFKIPQIENLNGKITTTQVDVSPEEWVKYKNMEFFNEKVKIPDPRYIWNGSKNMYESQDPKSGKVIYSKTIPNIEVTKLQQIQMESQGEVLDVQNFAILPVFQEIEREQKLQRDPNNSGGGGGNKYKYGVTSEQNSPLFLNTPDTKYDDYDTDSDGGLYTTSYSIKSVNDRLADRSWEVSGLDKTVLDSITSELKAYKGKEISDGDLKQIIINNINRISPNGYTPEEVRLYSKRITDNIDGATKTKIDIDKLDIPKEALADFSSLFSPGELTKEEKAILEAPSAEVAYAQLKKNPKLANKLINKFKENKKYYTGHSFKQYDLVGEEGRYKELTNVNLDTNVEIAANDVTKLGSKVSARIKGNLKTYHISDIRSAGYVKEIGHKLSFTHSGLSVMSTYSKDGDPTDTLTYSQPVDVTNFHGLNEEQTALVTSFQKRSPSMKLILEGMTAAEANGYYKMKIGDKNYTFSKSKDGIKVRVNGGLPDSKVTESIEGFNKLLGELNSVIFSKPIKNIEQTVVIDKED